MTAILSRHNVLNHCGLVTHMPIYILVNIGYGHGLVPEDAKFDTVIILNILPSAWAIFTMNNAKHIV